MFRNFVSSVAVLMASCSVSFGQIQLKVTLSANPASVNIVKENLKYGKFGVFCFVWDDRAPSSYNALSAMPSFSDGAGNQIPYTATVAFNGVNRYGFDAPGLSFSQIKTLIYNNWGIACHGYIHNLSDWADKGFTAYDNVVENRKYFYNNLKELGTEYVLRTGVVPNSDTGYHSAWKRIGSLCGTSQNAFDTFAATPANDWINNSIGDITNLSGGYHVFARAFNDINNQTGEDELHAKLTSLIQQSTSSANKILVFGTHETDNSFLQPELNFIHDNSNDHIWVTSLHELMEYAETINNTAVNYSLSGNVLTITLTQNLPDASRWRDISLGLTSDQTITGIESTGADDVSFNAATGLINVFKKKTSAFASPDLANIPLPLKFINLSVLNDALKWSVDNKEELQYFEVQKSMDGTHFDAIGTTTDEEFKDPSMQENQFYRVKAVEKNGKEIYSNVLRSHKTHSKPTMVYKQGSAIRIDFYSPKNQTAALIVFNSGGQQLYKSEEKLFTGWNTVLIPGLQNQNIYFIKLASETLRFIK